MIRRLHRVLPLAAAAAGGALAAALLLGQAYAWSERRIGNWIGGAR